MFSSLWNIIESKSGNIHAILIRNNAFKLWIWSAIIPMFGLFSTYENCYIWYRFFFCHPWAKREKMVLQNQKMQLLRTCQLQSMDLLGILRIFCDILYWIHWELKTFRNNRAISTGGRWWQRIFRRTSVVFFPTESKCWKWFKTRRIALENGFEQKVPLENGFAVKCFFFLIFLSIFWCFCLPMV